MLSFSGKTAVVTGAGGGMGLAVARCLVEQGVNVSMADIKPEPDNAPDGPAEWSYTRCDLAQEPSARELVGKTIEQFGGIDYFVNTLGVLWFGRDVAAEDIDLAIWDQVFSVNLRATVILFKQAVPEMKKAGKGAMVHFSSIDALRGDPVPQDAYGASKAALIRLSKSPAIQYAGKHIRSNVILPGPVMMPMQKRWENQPESREQVAGSIPLGRLGAVDDMVSACLFLLSDQAACITGTELVVDGGLTALP